jgi:hypothetical protein
MSSAMENNKNADMNRWVDERLNALTPGDDFRPNAAWALARFRNLRETKFPRGRMWGWTAAAASAVFLFVFALPAPRAVAQRCLNFCYVTLLQSAPLADRPEYVGAQLVRPADYREWIYLSSGLGMEYNPAAGSSEDFTNVFVAPWAYREFMSTGKWPDKAMFVLEGRASQTKGSINKSGHFQSDLKSVAVEVKDEKRYADKWAYFSFRGDTMTAEAMTGPADACWQCHDSNAAVEHTFVQFYPTLKPVAMKFGTYRAQAE